MKENFLLFILISVLMVTHSVSQAQEYHWPLEAKPAVTSTFCEYRPEHFHSGIDLKTWGNIGLRINAVDDGYVWRIKVSPWGSGRSVYVKLANGFIAAYFHLSEFIPSIQDYVENEQERLGRYSIDLFLSPDDVPVTSGQLIGYSGESGIGGPHLHFELRDRDNRPVNPMMHGFSVKDTIPPIVTKLSISPLDLHSRVNGRHRTLVIPVREVKDGLCRIDQRLRVSGCVGFAVSLYDRANAAWNKVSVYRTDLFIDGELMFRTQYDAFSFDETRQVDLDRDFTLMRSGEGTFQRLYTMTGNSLPFYAADVPKTTESEDTLGSSPPGAWTSVPGWHTVRIVGGDANGNEAIVEMNVLVDRSPEVFEFESHRRNGKLVFEAVARDEDSRIRKVQFDSSTDFGEHWAVVGVDSTNSPPDVYRVEIREDWAGPFLGRARACDVFGVWSAPELCYVSDKEDAKEDADNLGKLTFECEPRFQNTFIEWMFTSNRPLNSSTHATLFRHPDPPLHLPVTRLDAHTFSVRSSYEPDLNGQVLFIVESQDMWGAPRFSEIPFEAFKITRAEGGNVRSADGVVSASFETGGVYWDLWTRIDIGSVHESPFLPMRSNPYLFNPDDVPFDAGARIAIHCGLKGEHTHRVGVYRYLDDETWGYVRSEADTLNEIITANVFSFGTFVLLEDTIPPKIWNLRPKEGSKVRAQNLHLFARVKDQGSGLGREEDLLIQLDGLRMISEYDPEGEWLACKVKAPLSQGSHRLRVSVTDLAGNTTSRESTFWVTP